MIEKLTCRECGNEYAREFAFQMCPYCIDKLERAEINRIVSDRLRWLKDSLSDRGEFAYAQQIEAIILILTPQD